MLRYMAIMPHGNEAVYPIDEDSKILNANLKKIGEELKDVESYVLITPHNVRSSEAIAIVIAENLIPWLLFNDVPIPVESEYKTDVELAREIYLSSKDKFPVVDVNFASARGRYSRFPLTWGEMIPLHFLRKKPLVLISPPREVKREVLVEFGKHLGRVLEGSEKEVALIVSADHGHAHDPKGPYGYAKESKEYDSLIYRLMQNMDFSRLLELENDFIEKAKPDSYWSLLIAHGVMQEVKFSKVVHISYACPTYYGMLSALFKR
ncbi:extradiol dioxygenase [Pyrococcus furiosus DSM 3638]|uniref:Extradiol ring-cleavage dioxygenase class III enzyme subunit B domain-containing protein n=3 Tax=Pyrococcus furiosus TaxID=2261 RepID=Q8U360_PYRFU|nr:MULTISPECIES: extradiol dioxygenase [Pyrococcus]AAL80736.1 hypothetical protein PF0612 [Pyrococcus furiosus DSM 3638]AFN03405.1 hypothetical protein PFC_02200 [Pyrococcus furiosus COM1]QEK78317.1 extradiol dioxygenase [Pyrococcus furiosus DSM 3638]